MAINVTKPAINLREKLNEVTLETGIKGEELLNSDTSTEARNVLELDTHLFTDFESTGIDDNATSTKLTVSATGVDVTGSVTCDGFTSTGIDDNATSNSLTLTDSAYTFTSINSAPILKHETTHGSGIPLFDLKGAASTQIRYLDELGAVQTRIDMGDSGTTSFIDAASNVARMQISSAGNVTVNTGNLVIGTSGKGIDFSATSDGSGTMTSEVLDDYEEGTWTPTIGNFTVNSGTWGATGRYIKIGNSVTVSMVQTGGTISWAASNYLGGLPFAPISGIYGTGGFTNGHPNIGGEVLAYHSGSVLYFAQAGTSQTSLMVSATYIVT